MSTPPPPLQHATLAITEHHGWFAIDVAGRYDLEDAQALIHRVLAEADARQVRRALVDLLQVAGNIPDWERFFLGKETAAVLGASVQLAVVAPAEKINYFWENVAVNRGARVGVFPNRLEAQAWLLRGAPPTGIRRPA